MLSVRGSSSQEGLGVLPLRRGCRGSSSQEGLWGGSACTDAFFTVRKACLSYGKRSTEMPTLTLVPVSVWLLASYSVAVNLLLSLKNQKEHPRASGGVVPDGTGHQQPSPHRSVQRDLEGKLPRPLGALMECSGPHAPTHLVCPAVLHLTLQVEGLAFRGQVREDVLKQRAGRGRWRGETGARARTRLRDPRAVEPGHWRGDTVGPAGAQRGVTFDCMTSLTILSSFGCRKKGRVTRGRGLGSQAGTALGAAGPACRC